MNAHHLVKIHLKKIQWTRHSRIFLAITKYIWQAEWKKRARATSTKTERAFIKDTRRRRKNSWFGSFFFSIIIGKYFNRRYNFFFLSLSLAKFFSLNGFTVRQALFLKGEKNLPFFFTLYWFFEKLKSKIFNFSREKIKNIEFKFWIEWNWKLSSISC